MSPLCVVKLGGSLLDLPDLAPRLTAYLRNLRVTGYEQLALVVGGGPTTDAVRSLDRIHGLGDAVAHDLALRGLTLNAYALLALLGQGHILSQRADTIRAPWTILDPWALLGELERDSGRPLLPHTWDATSDSVAMVLAESLGAAALHLLKSVGPAGPLDPGGLHPNDIVDPCFLSLWRACPGLAVEVVPMRR